MKRSILMALCLSVVAAFAGPYDISEFEAKDAGQPDEYISAEFGGELKTIPADEVSTLQEGRLVLRQRFEDPFDPSATAYQLYQGTAGNVSSMTAMTAEGVDYAKLLSAKLYEKRGTPANQDVEKVYFDGKSVFAPGLTSAIAFIDGAPITLKGEGVEEPVEEAAAPAAKPACDEYETDCEDDDEDLSQYRTAAPVDNTTADSRDIAANDAAESATDRFGVADEVRFWSAIGLSALAVASAVIGVVHHMKANKAQDAYDDLAEINDNIMGACHGDATCEAIVLQQCNKTINMEDWSVKALQEHMDENQKTHDSYASARNIWFGIAGASIAGAVVLFVW